MLQLKPIHKNIYIKKIESEAKTASGLYLGTIKSDVETGLVLASASDLIKVGEKVIFNKHSGSKVDDNFLIIKEDHILGIVE